MAVSHRVCWELDLYSSTLITPLFCSKNHVSTCLTLLNTFLYISCFLCFKPSDKKQVGRERPSSVLLASRVLFLFCFPSCHYVLQYKGWKVWKSLFSSQKHFTTRDFGKMISCLSCHVEGSDKSCKSLTSQPCFPRPSERLHLPVSQCCTLGEKDGHLQYRGAAGHQRKGRLYQVQPMGQGSSILWGTQRGPQTKPLPGFECCI